MILLGVWSVPGGSWQNPRVLDPQADALCERILRSGSGGFAGRSIAEIRRHGLDLAGTWSLDDLGLGLISHLSRAGASTLDEVAESLDLPRSEVRAGLAGLRRGGFVRAKERPRGEEWSAVISGRGRGHGDAAGALAALAGAGEVPGRAPEPGSRRDVAIGDGVTVRIYVPDSGDAGDGALLPVVLFFHGGAFVSGTLDGYDCICESVVELVGALVVSVGYRLVPEHPFPAAVDDARAALRWLTGHADEIGADRSRIAVMGDSAGACLATVLALLARREGADRPVFQVLLYPTIDATMSSPSMVEHAYAPLYSADDVVWMYEQYAAPADDWRGSPLGCDDLRGSPPALIVNAEVDPVRDDGARYAERLREAGVDVVHEEFAGMMHGFYEFAPTLDGASRARELVADALTRAFGLDR